MTATVSRLPRFLGGGRMKAQQDGDPVFAGYDAQLECLMACIEELSRLEGRKGAAVRRQTLDWICERFALEDNQKAEQARSVE